MIDFTKPVQTRSGKPVRIFATDLKADRPVIGCIPHPNQPDRELMYSWYLDGSYCAGAEHATDLVQAPEEVEYYLNMYATNRPMCHETKERADSNASDCRLSCIRVVYDKETGNLIKAENC